MLKCKKERRINKECLTTTTTTAYTTEQAHTKQEVTGLQQQLLPEPLVIQEEPPEVTQSDLSFEVH